MPALLTSPCRPPEVLGDARDHLADLLLAGDVAQVGAGLATGGCRRPRLRRAVWLRSTGPGVRPCLPVLGHGAAEATAAAGDDDDLVLRLHARLLVVLVKRERRPPGNRYAGRSVVPDRIEPQVSAEALQACPTTSAQGIPRRALHAFPGHARLSVRLGRALLPDARGWPLLLISRIAQHTRNLRPMRAVRCWSVSAPPRTSRQRAGSRCWPRPASSTMGRR